MASENTTVKKQVEINKSYTLLETKGYSDKEEAFQRIKHEYGAAGRVVTYYYRGLWYIVQKPIWEKQETTQGTLFSSK